jgi:hypothetical protein
MHATDTGSNDGSSRRPQAVPECDEQPHIGNDERHREWRYGQPYVVADGNTGHVRKLSDEMGRPHARAENHRRHGQPGKIPFAVVRLPRTDEKVRGRKTSEETDQARKYDEPKIVLIDDAAVNPQHLLILGRLSDDCAAVVNNWLIAQKESRPWMLAKVEAGVERVDRLAISGVRSNDGDPPTRVFRSVLGYGWNGANRADRLSQDERPLCVPKAVVYWAKRGLGAAAQARGPLPYGFQLTAVGYEFAFGE